jgi:hypothetical protein
MVRDPYDSFLVQDDKLRQHAVKRTTDLRRVFPFDRAIDPSREHGGGDPVTDRDVLVRVWANSLNFRELLILDGTYPLPVKPDVVMGANGAGEIVALGPDVNQLFMSSLQALVFTFSGSPWI